MDDHIFKLGRVMTLDDKIEACLKDSDGNPLREDLVDWQTVVKLAREAMDLSAELPDQVGPLKRYDLELFEANQDAYETGSLIRQCREGMRVLKNAKRVSLSIAQFFIQNCTWWDHPKRVW